MSANVEMMFYTREKPWHGLGVRVEEAPTSADRAYSSNRTAAGEKETAGQAETLDQNELTGVDDETLGGILQSLEAFKG